MNKDTQVLNALTFATGIIAGTRLRLDQLGIEDHGLTQVSHALNAVLLANGVTSRLIQPATPTTELRVLPAQPKRVETGPVQFGDDWPGMFIRGDNAAHFAYQLLETIEHLHSVDPFTLAAIRGLQQTLASAVVGPARDLLQPCNKETQ